MTGFPLFRLPLPPLKTFFDILGLGELISLHMCSKKTRKLCRTMKKSVIFDAPSPNEKDKLNAMELIRRLSLEIQNNECFPKDSIRIKISISGRLNINIEKNYSFPLSIDLLPIQDSVVDPKKKNLEVGHQMYSFWNDQYEGFNFWVDYFKKFFNSETIECCINASKSQTFSENLKNAVMVLNQHTTASCSVKGNSIYHDDYKLILNNFNNAIRFEQVDHLKLVNDNFHCNTRFTSDYFVLEPANWFTLDNLLSMDCAEIELWQSRLTNADMYDNMLRWMDGKYPKLKHLTVQLQEKVNLSLFMTRYKLRCLPAGRQNDPQRYTLVESDIIHIKQGNKIVGTISSKSSAENMFEMEIL